MSDAPDPPAAPHADLESTSSLIQRARGGDKQALERLFARHLRPLQRWASGRLPKWARDLADTDDLVQDTLLRTFKKIDTFEPRRVGALQAYLRNAVVNRLRDELRRKGREPESTNLDNVEIEGDSSPLEAAIGRERVEAYEKARYQGADVMLATDGRAVLMDFGTGWEWTEASASTSALAGTPLYLAPELLRGDDATIQSDVYSVGVLLYRMLTGAYPVCADNLADLRLAHERLDQLVLRKLPRHVPRRLAHIIERAIDPDATRRYQSADALAMALDALGRRATSPPLKRAIALTAALGVSTVVFWGGALQLRDGAVRTRGALQLTSEVSTAIIRQLLFRPSVAERRRPDHRAGDQRSEHESICESWLDDQYRYVRYGGGQVSTDGIK